MSRQLLRVPIPVSKVIRFVASACPEEFEVTSHWGCGHHIALGAQWGLGDYDVRWYFELTVCNIGFSMTWSVPRRSKWG